MFLSSMKWYQLQNTKSLFKWTVTLCFSLLIIGLLMLFCLPDSPLKWLLISFMEWIAHLPKEYGALLFAAVQCLVIVLVLPATPFNMAAGFLFGTWTGSLVSLIATDIASIIAFFIGRYVARPWAEHQMANSPKFQALDTAVAQQGLPIITLVRLSPVFPFGLCNYCFGLTPVPFWKYWLGTTIGLFPYTIAYTYLGTLTREISDVFSKQEDDVTRLNKIILLIVGCGITVITVIVVAFMTKRAIRNSINIPVISSSSSSSSSSENNKNGDPCYEEREEELDLMEEDIELQEIICANDEVVMTFSECTVPCTKYNNY